MADRKSLRKCEVSALQQVRQAGKLVGWWHGWVIPPLWANVIKGDTSLRGLTSLKGIPPMWDPPMWDAIIKMGYPLVGLMSQNGDSLSVG